MYCAKCGAEITAGSVFCAKCGYKIIEDYNTNLEDNNDNENNALKVKIIASLIGMVIGLVVVIICLVTYVNDTSTYWGYNYKPPLTNHEIMVVAFGIGGSAGMIIDLIRLISYTSKVKKI